MTKDTFTISYQQGKLDFLLQGINIPSNKRTVDKKSNVRWMLRNLKRLNPEKELKDIFELLNEIRLSIRVGDHVIFFNDEKSREDVGILTKIHQNDYYVVKKGRREFTINKIKGY